MKSAFARGHRGSDAARFAASALALLFLYGQVASYAHLANVRHVRCADHGELIDLHGDQVEAAPADASAGPRLIASHDCTSHRHEHCAIAAQRRESSAGAEHHEVATVAPRAVAREFTASPDRPHTPLALYRLAPKTSPPL